MVGQAEWAFDRGWRRFAPSLVAAVLLLAPLAACAPGGDLPMVAPYQPTSYALGSGDQIRVITFGEDQLTGEFRVDDQGRIAFPLLGNVTAAGRTPTELGQTLGAELTRKGLLRTPSVSVEVLTYRPIFVLGEVAKPGQYPYQPGMTVVTTVAIAGGYTYRAFDDYVLITRTTGKAVQQGKALPSAFVAPGDVIKVYERHF